MKKWKYIPIIIALFSIAIIVNAQPSWHVINPTQDYWIAKYDNNSFNKDVDMSQVNWGSLKQIGIAKKNKLTQIESISGLDRTFNHILFYPNYQQNSESGLHLLVKLHAKIGDNTYDKWITKNHDTLSPYYMEDGDWREIGYTTTLEAGSQTIPVSLGIKSNNSGRGFNTRINATFPVDVDDSAVEYIITMNPNTIVRHRPKYLQAIKDGQLITRTISDMMGEEAITKGNVSFVSFLNEDYENLMTFDFSDVFINATHTLWKIQQTTLPNSETLYTFHVTGRYGAFSAGETLTVDPSWNTPSGISSSTMTNSGNLIDGNSNTYAHNGRNVTFTLNNGATYNVSGIELTIGDNQAQYCNMQVNIFRAAVSTDTTFTDSEAVLENVTLNGSTTDQVRTSGTDHGVGDYLHLALYNAYIPTDPCAADFSMGGVVDSAIYEFRFYGTELNDTGEPCSGNVDCSLGFCTDGYCCDEACGGTCQACNISGSLGTCTSHTVDTDPESECGTTNCYTGDCSGSDSCKVYSNSEEGNCPACQYCTDSDSDCEFISDNNRDQTGNNKCEADCKTCDGLGNCVNQDEDEDLFSQCSGFDCDGDASTPYYFGWTSNICYYRIDVSDVDAVCDGSGSCKDDSALCPSQAQDGTTGVECDCSSAETGCSGTTIGTCSNNDCSSIILSLSNPADEYSTISSTNITFQASSTNFYDLVNTTLYVWNSTGEYTSYTNDTATTGSIFLTTFSLDRNDYTWNAYSCDAVQCNWSTNRTMNITNTLPTASDVSISPSPTGDDDDLTCNYTYSDYDGDTENTVNREVYWYKDDTILPLLNDSITLDNGNSSVGDRFFCNISISDGLNNTLLYTSPEITVGDTSLPTNTSVLSVTDTNPCSTDNSLVSIDVSDQDSNIQTVYLETDLPTGLQNVSMTCGEGSSVSCSYTFSGYNQLITIQTLHIADSSNNWANLTINQGIAFQSCGGASAGGGGGGSRDGCGKLSIVQFEPKTPRKNAYVDFGIRVAKVGCNITSMWGNLNIDSLNQTYNFTFENITATSVWVIAEDVQFSEPFDASVYFNYLDAIGVKGTDNFKATVELDKSFFEEYQVFIILLVVLGYFLFINPARQG